MSRGSKVQINYATQTTDEVPKTGWKVLPYKSNGLSASFEKTDSETITDSRISSAGLVTSGSLSGDIEVEFSKDEYDDLLSAAACNNWSGNALTFGGDVVKNYAFEVAFKDVGIFHYYGGVRVNTFELSLADSGYATAKFGLMGSDYKNQNDTAFSKTPTPAGQLQKVTSLSVEDIKIDGITTKGVACATAFDFKVDNNIQEQRCLGGGIFAGKLLEMMAKMEGSLTLAYGKKAQEIVNKQVTGATVAIEITLKFPDGSKYVLAIPKAQVSGETPSGGMNDIINQSVTYTVVEQAPTMTKVPAV
ncbi:phage tail tube protein [Moraxella haemolytica]|uniref:phage tail tube protein n=1 Tax=Moraxella haemolytica TaxID=2904119 RepID=UPI002542BC5A|nr:phage tail tube protein [Moraxella sp. ZY171148]WII95991.1 phage tail tube protein [Moraxella sp. ZY171148]